MEFNPVTKKSQLFNKRVKPSQRQMGTISNIVREQVFERSEGICERCKSQRAMQMAHLIGRKQIKHVTNLNDIIHVCIKIFMLSKHGEEWVYHANKIQYHCERSIK